MTHPTPAAVDGTTLDLSIGSHDPAASGTV